jgi:hypothetical protein
MKRTRLLLPGVVLATMFLMMCGPSEVDLEGQAFIVTQGADSIKLGLVEVKVFEELRFTSFIQEKRQNAASIISGRLKAFHDQETQKLQRVDEVLKEYVKEYKRTHSEKASENLREALMEYVRMEIKLKAQEAALERQLQNSIWLENLPTPSYLTKTDADGKFSLKLKPGRYALAAEATRKIADKTEEYYWLIWLDVSKKNTDKLFLTNDNLLTAFAPSCVVRPDDIPVLPKTPSK